MLSAKERAAGTAPKSNRQVESYRSVVLASRKNPKDDIGELLWGLQFSVGSELQQIGWGLFEKLLRLYMGLGVPPQSAHKHVESTISPQRLSG